jgi:endo-1,4-beta-xylanase
MGSRRFLLLLLLGCPAFAQSLRQEAAHSGILVGTAVNPVYLNQPAYTSTLAREYNMLEPEDAMKWYIVQPDDKTINFAPADQLVEFAAEHGMKVRGHCMLWGGHDPKWLASHTPEELSQILQQHITLEVGRYRGRVFAWDVVNEALDGNGKLRDSVWYNQPGIGMAAQGTAYIEQAFRWVHAIDPQALLFYNEAEAEGMNKKSDALYAMVKDFRHRGVPIDGVGMQLHILDLNPDVRGIAENMKRLTALGLQVHITELDVALPVDADGNPRHAEDLVRQAEIYREIANVCLQNPGCTALQTWGFTDKYSWIGWFTHKTKGAALPLDRQYRPKPAYNALLQALHSATQLRSGN